MHDVAETIEPILLTSWPAHVTEHHDGWLLRFAAGYTSRANSVHILEPSVTPLESRLSFASEWYAARHLPLSFRLVEGTLGFELDDRLGAAFGRSPCVETLIRTGTGHASSTTVVSRHAGPDWLAAKRRLGGFRPGPSGRWEQIVAAIGAPTIFGAIEHDDEIVGIGLAVVVDEWTGVFDVLVSAEHRRHGHGTTLVEALIRAGSVLGGRQTYLQVEETNTPALRLYETMGFARTYRYWYRTSDQADVSSPPRATG